MRKSSITNINPFYSDIDANTKNNKAYRRVVYTVPGSMQLVLMSIPPNDEIHKETHPHTTQFIKVEGGVGVATIGDKKFALAPGISVVIPPNTEHHIQNSSGNTPLSLYTIYTPPEHPEGLVQVKK